MSKTTERGPTAQCVGGVNLHHEAMAEKDG